MHPWRFRTYWKTIAKRTGLMASFKIMHMRVEKVKIPIEIMFIWVEYHVKVPIVTW